MSSLPANQEPPAARYSSLAALLAAHGDLLRRMRAEGETAAFQAEVLTLLQSGAATGALLAEDADRRQAQSALDYWVARLYRLGAEPPDATLAEFDPLLAPELADALCPYLGLDAFREDDSAKFFGRRELIGRMLERLAGCRLIAVVGPSGSGKSSLVRAGLIPALKGGALPGSAGWRYPDPIVPGSEPLAALQQAENQAPRIAHQEPGAASPQPRAGHHEPGAVATPAVLGAPMLDSAPTVLVIDQFEELFTLCDDEATRQAFVARLLALVQSAEPQHRVILTMRSDFESFVTRLPALYTLFEAGRVQVTPLSAAELREVIEQPAEAVGLKFEQGVVDLLLQDILGEPAGLPLLQFTLLKLWGHRQRNRVMRAAYDHTGGGRLALARCADGLYAELIPEEQATARRILLRMVRPGAGLEITSSRVRRAELYRAGEDPGRIDRVLAKLIGERLLRLTEGATPGDSQVEVAHEALVRNWPTLVKWLEEERAAIATRRRLEGRAAEWQRLGAGQGGLLDEVELREAERWLAGAEAAMLGYDPALPELVAASKRAVAAAQASEYERQRALLRAEAEAASRKRLTQLVYALALVSLLALVFAMYALLQRNQVTIESNRRATVVVQRTTAEADARNQAQVASTASAESARQTRIARASELAARSQLALPRFPQQSLLLAVRANTIALDASEQPILAARQALYEALAGAGGRGLSGHTGPITSLAISRDSRWLAVASQDATILVWELGAAGAEHPRRLAGHTGSITALAISLDGRWLASSSQDTTARLWDLSARDPEAAARILPEHTAIVRTVAFSPDGHWLVTAGDDMTARLWDMTNLNTPAVPLSGHIGAIWLARFSPDGKWLATGGLDGAARVWDLAHPGSEAHVRKLGDQSHVLTGLLISPNSRWLITSTADRNIQRWDLASSDPNSGVVTLQGHRGDILALTLSPDGRLLASGGGEDRVRLWEIDTPDPNIGMRELAGLSGSLTALAFSPDSGWLAGSSTDQNVRLWDLQAADRMPRILPGHDGPVQALAFSPDGHWLVSGSDDATARIWPWPHHDDNAAARTLEGHTQAINVIAMSADGRRLATAGDDGNALVWDLSTSDPNAAPLVLREHTGRILAMALRADGRYLYTAGDDATVREWDLGASEPSRAVRRLAGHTDAVVALTLSPDQRHLVSASYDQIARVWDLALPDPSTAPVVLRGHTNQVLVAAFSPDGRYVATGSYDTSVRLWDLASPDPGADPIALERHTAPVTALVFSHDGRKLATASEDGELWLWDLSAPSTSTRVQKLAGNTGAIMALVLSPNGRLLASAGKDGVIRIWDLQSQAGSFEPRVLQGHGGSVLAVTFSSDSTQLASGGVDQTVRLWHLTDANTPGALVMGRHTGSVFQIAFFSHDAALVSAGQDGTAFLWELRPAPLVARACVTAGRPLTHAEWNLFIPNQPYNPGCALS